MKRDGMAYFIGDPDGGRDGDCDPDHANARGQRAKSID